MKKLVFFLMVICLLPYLPAVAVPTEDFIESGDSVHLQIVGVLDETYAVNEEGNIDFGLWGKIDVLGMNSEQAKEAIKKGLSKVVYFDKNRPVFLSIIKKAAEESWLRYRPEQVVHIFGQLNTPGRYEFKKGFTLIDILSHTGGATDPAADTTKISIISNGRATIFNLKEYLKSGGALPDIKVGDVIVIPSKTSVYMTGQVTNPGRYNFTEGINFMDCLALAGGLTEKADTKRVSIIRKNQPSQMFNFYMYQQGKEAGLPQLIAEDVIYIPAIEPDKWVRRDPKTVINIIGAVNNPGRYDVEPDNLNIIDIITAAGGFAEEADTENIKILHRNPLGDEKKAIAVLFDFDHFQESGTFDNLPEIQLGDTIVVPGKKKNFWQEFETIGGTLQIIGNTFTTVAIGMALGQTD